MDVDPKLQVALDQLWGNIVDVNHADYGATDQGSRCGADFRGADTEVQDRAPYRHLA